MARASALDARIFELGSQIFERLSGKTPSIFDKQWWNGRVLEWCMRDDAFKVEMFRFVDAFPQLADSEAVARHLQEYFCRPEQDFPSALQWGLKAVSPGSRVARLVAGTIEKNIRQMAARFIAGTTAEEALPKLIEMRGQNLAFTVDLLGEACVSEAEAADYQRRYFELLETLAREAAGWTAKPLLDHDENGPIPRVNVSVKVSALDSQLDPVDREGSVRRLVRRLKPLLLRAKALGAFVNLDMESFALKDLTLEAFRRCLVDPDLAEGPALGVVIQAYLKDSEADLEQLLKDAKRAKRHFTVRLVKGAYWDYEVILAQQHGWDVPVFQDKDETDQSFERLTALLLRAKGRVTAALGSHNVRSLAHGMAFAESLGLDKRTFEFQMLYGMAEPIKATLVEMGYRVRDYVPVGQLVPGMAYLVRRLLENTSNESFLRTSFVESAPREELLAAPRPGRHASHLPAPAPPAWGGNAVLLDFRRPAAAPTFEKALAYVEKKGLGVRVPVVVGGQIRVDREHLASRYPAEPSRVVAECALATPGDVDEAVQIARDAQRGWGAREPVERAAILRKAAQILRKRRVESAALQVYEVAKTRLEADADVCEAIDFLQYYAAEAERLGAGVLLGHAPGESNRLVYRPRGVAAIIAPWNFPLAILTGMTSAALVTGNAALMKPAEQSPAVAWGLYQLLIEAGVPKEVLHFLPGVGEVVGPALVEHPGVDLIAFTGSRAVGLEIMQRAAVVRPGQRNLKRVIAEMGGKNAVIVDDDADLDEAVQGIVQSAYGFQGQKCSACSRVIAVGPSYDSLVGRVVEATRSLSIGPPTDPGAKVGPVIDAVAQERINRTVEAARRDFALALRRDVPARGSYVGPAVFVDVDPDHDVAQNEIFGPVLAMIRARDFDHALALANGTAYALTGGVFSRSPAHIEQALREFDVGNLYINRGTTGALVGRQPFGGSAMSGVGSKAGGPDYLLQFVEPRTLTENTMRRGFSPETV